MVMFNFSTLPAQKVFVSENTPKILIFWGGGNLGHLQAARAVESRLYARSAGVEVNLKDIMEFQRPLIRKTTVVSYDLLTKFFPKYYDGLVDKMLDQAESLNEISDLATIKLYRPARVLAAIEESKPTHIFSTFSPATEVLVYLRQKIGALKNVKLAQVLTDYMGVSYFARLGQELEMTFASDKQTANALGRLGLSHKKMKVSGIPVLADHSQRIDGSQRKRLLENIGFKFDQPFVFIMSGAAGLGNYKGWIESLALALENKKSQVTQILVVAGRNQKLHDQLKKYTPPPWIDLKVLGFIESSLALSYMSAADLFIGKPGALTATETLYLGVPSVFIDVHGGQEKYNAQHFEENNLALFARDTKSIGVLGAKLLTDPDLRSQLNKNQKAAVAEIDSTAIANWVFA